MPKTKSKTNEFKTASEFEALPDSEKERIYQQLDSESPQERLAKSTPLDSRDPTRQRKFMRRGGRPRLGRDGVKVIALSVEQGLLKRADRYAKAKGLKRAELFTKAIMKFLPKAG